MGGNGATCWGPFPIPLARLVDSLEILAHAIDPIVRPLPTYLQPATKVN